VDHDNPQETPTKGDCHEERRPRSFIASDDPARFTNMSNPDSSARRGCSRFRRSFVS
jgi:hypothetical protein